ncbi:phage tail protein [Streptomyces chartreusis]|uniref:phage tail protein n=1 Tax=Streptomyces chartreusis TaxID=1969 RepID=UPI0033D232AA
MPKPLSSSALSAVTNPVQLVQQASALTGLLGQRTTRSPGRYPQAGLTMRFKVVVDGLLDLGHWSSCRGLKVEFKSREIFEGGNYFGRELLPDRLAFAPVTLERVLTNEDAGRVQEWLRTVAKTWIGHGYGQGEREYEGQNVVISLLDYQGDLVTDWTLKGAIPREWSGPDLSASGNGVAVERLVFDHHGFLEG